ncbi:MAG: hypothetical protein DHS20C19_07100 [Acidimicrobiales bacterium]|nr:MAG: hypothetical protein DHS20C19_07100 [Acidimicrobiales bacterium]
MHTILRGPRAVASALLVVLAVVAAACSGGGVDVAEDEPTTTSTTSTSTTTTTTTEPEGPPSPLTGEALDDESILDAPAIVVKISNNNTVQDSWAGIERADVVIEERIEARATRFAAIFHSDLPDRVGPIRSGRTSDLDLLTNLGAPILVYSGANTTVTGQLRGLERDDLVTLVVDRATNVDLVRDDSLGRPDNLFSDLGEILEKYRDDAGTATPLFAAGFDADAPSGGESGDGATVDGADSVAFVWDGEGSYVRVQNGEIHETADGEPFAFANVVVYETVYRRSTIDPDSVDADTVGEGAVHILRDGRRYSGTWSRAANTDPFLFTDADGNEIALTPGSTWVTLAPAGSYGFEVDDETAALLTEADG